MAKGFGVKADEQLGYVLLLMPEVKAYAAKFSIDYFPTEDDEEFIGVTSMLEQAQIWKTLKQAKNAIEKYAEFLISEAKDDSPIPIKIRKIKRRSDGELIDEPAETIFLAPQINT